MKFVFACIFFFVNFDFEIWKMLDLFFQEKKSMRRHFVELVKIKNKYIVEKLFVGRKNVWSSFSPLLFWRGFVTFWRPSCLEWNLFCQKKNKFCHERIFFVINEINFIINEINFFTNEIYFVIYEINVFTDEKYFVKSEFYLSILK